MVKIGTVKRGDTFSFTVDFVDAAGAPQVYPVSALKCQVRDSADSLIAGLAIVDVPATPGQYVISADSTLSWPLTALYIDIRINYQGVHSSSETMELIVVQDITRWEA